MIEIIPAMDLMDAKCVRLTNGDFSRQTVYSGDPVETAKRFEDAGLRRLHMVDLDGARAGRPFNLSILEQVSRSTSLEIDYGGGVKTLEDAKAVFDRGAAILTIGSLASRQPEKFLDWVNQFGVENVLLGADSRDGKVAIDGWKTTTGTPILAFLRRFAERGITRAFVTDIAFDGTMNGPSLGLYRRITASIQEIELIASGGVRSTNDIDALNDIGCSGVIVGKALYEGAIVLADLKKYVS